MIAAAGELGETQVALEHDGLGLARNAGEAKPRRHLALVHHAVLGERRLFQMMDDERAEILGVGEHVPHHLGVGEARLAVGEGDGAGVAQETDLGHLLALQALGHRRHGMHVDARRVARAAHDEVDQRHVVDDGLGIGHADDGGDAAGGRGPARGGQRLAVLVPRLAGEHQHVDEAGSEHMTAAVDHLRITYGAGGYARADIEDLAVLDQHATRLVEAGAWIDQPRIEQCGAAAVVLSRGLHRHQWLGRWRASA